MKTTVNFYEFRNWFKKNRPNDFSYDGLIALWEMLEEYEEGTGEEIEFDPVTIWSDYTEYENIEEFWTERDEDEYPDIESIKERTTLIKVGNKGFIIKAF
jgi:hypothetical protein